MSYLETLDAESNVKSLAADGAASSADPAVGLVRATSMAEIFSVTPTITAGAYSADRVIGGKITIADFLPVAGKTAMIENVWASCKASVAPFIDLMCFLDDPSGGTYTDTSAPSPTDADLAKFFGVFSLTNWVGFGTKRVCAAPLTGSRMRLVGTSLFVVPVIRGGVTFASTTDLTFFIARSRD